METVEGTEGTVAPESEEIEQQQPEPETGQEPEQVQPEGEPEPEPKPEKKLKGVGKRLHQLTSRIHQLESELAQRAKPEVKPEPLKSLKDFEYDEAKYSSYLFDRARAEAVEAARVEAATYTQRQRVAETRKSFEARLADFADEHPDLYDGWDETPISQPMAEAIEVSEVGPEVAYYLKNNQDVALKLYELPPVAAAKEIGRIEARIVMEREKAKEKPVSKAPPPPPKIEGSDPGNVERDPSKMTDAQFRKWREQSIARRGSYR